MAVTISLFVDYQQASIEEQKELLTNLAVKNVALRKINGQPITTISEEELNDYANFLSKNKIKVNLIDPLVNGYSIYQDEEIKAHEALWQQAILIATKFKSSAINYRIPLFKDIIAENKIILELIKKDILLAKKNKLEVVLKFDNNYKSNTYVYLLSHLKESSLSVGFEPLYIQNNKESLTTSFRILKDNFNYVNCDDVDSSNHPRLIGFGKLEWMDFFKKLFKIKYNGCVILDLSLLNAIDTKNKKTSIFKRFRKSHKQKVKVHHDLIARVGSDDPLSILKHQIQILNLVFYNK